MKNVNRVSFWLHLFIGVGGMAGGFAAITNPASPMGAPTDMLVNSPFTDFFIPGLILFGFIGVCNVLAALLYKFKSVLRGYASGVMGGGLMVWLIVQCIMIQGVGALHVIFFVLGLVQAILAVAILYDADLFPLNIVKKLFRRA